MLESVRELAAVELAAAGETERRGGRPPPPLVRRARRGPRTRDRPGRPPRGAAGADRGPRQRPARRRQRGGRRRRGHGSAALRRDGPVLDLRPALDRGHRPAPRGARPARGRRPAPGPRPRDRRAAAAAARRPRRRRRHVHRGAGAGGGRRGRPRAGPRAVRGGAHRVPGLPAGGVAGSCGRSRWRAPSGPGTSGPSPAPSAASPSPRAAGASRTSPASCSTGRSSSPGGSGTTSCSASCSARRPRCTSGSGTTRWPPTSTATRWSWPPRSATSPRARCCSPSSAGSPCSAGTSPSPQQLAGEAVGFAEEFVNRRVLAHALRLQGETLLRRGRPDGRGGRPRPGPGRRAGVRRARRDRRGALLAGVGRLEQLRLDDARDLADRSIGAVRRSRTRCGWSPRLGARRRGPAARATSTPRPATSSPAAPSSATAGSRASRRNGTFGLACVDAARGRTGGGRRRPRRRRCGCGTGWATGWASRSH